MTNLGPVPLVPWGTTRSFGQNNTTRRLLFPWHLGVGVTSYVSVLTLPPTKYLFIFTRYAICTVTKAQPISQIYAIPFRLVTGSKNLSSTYLLAEPPGHLQDKKCQISITLKSNLNCTKQVWGYVATRFSLTFIHHKKYFSFLVTCESQSFQWKYLWNSLLVVVHCAEHKQ